MKSGNTSLPLFCLLQCPAAAGDLWLLAADDASTLLDAVLESFRIQDRAVSIDSAPVQLASAN